MKSTLEDDRFKDSVTEDERKNILDKCSETINWLEGNQTAEVDEFKDKQKAGANIYQNSENCIQNIFKFNQYHFWVYIHNSRTIKHL